MLWEDKYKIILSLSFCIVFSIISLLWQTNPFAYSSVYFSRIVEQSNFFFKNILNLPFIFIERISEYSDLKEKYQKSLEEIEKYKSQKEQYEILLKENQKLRELLDFKPTTLYPEIKAQVLGIRLNSITPRIIINKGKKHKIQPFMPVIAFTSDENNHPIRAVVGLTAIVQDSNTIIQPLQHPQMKLGVKIENTNQWAILEGDSFSFKRLKLQYVTSASFQEYNLFIDPYIEIRNSRVVTSGNDGIFPPGIPVGKIIGKASSSDDNFASAYVKPYVEIDKLEFVIIILKTPEVWSYSINQKKELNLMQTPFSDEFIPSYLVHKEETKQKVEKRKKPITKKPKKEIKRKQENSIETKNQLVNPNDPFQ